MVTVIVVSGLAYFLVGLGTWCYRDCEGLDRPITKGILWPIGAAYHCINNPAWWWHDLWGDKKNGS